MSDVQKRLHHLMRRQVGGGPEDGLPEKTAFILLSVFLDPADLETIRPLLPPCPPDVGTESEVGRYLGVPVRPKEAVATFPFQVRGHYQGIACAYVRATSVFVGDIPD